jgi:hypothetical protein
VGSGGRISLPGEYGLEQRFLLQTEGVHFKGKNVDMQSFEYHFSPKRPAYKPASSGTKSR